MGKSFGVKESLELLEAIELGAISGIEIAKDGLGADDIPKALALLTHSEVLIKGFQGLGDIDDELKDLDQEELVKLGLASFSMIKKIAASIKKDTVA